MQKFLIFKLLNLMPKFKYRVMTAKEFLKGTSGAKVSIVLHRLYLFFKKINMQTQGVAISSAQGVVCFSMYM